MKGYWNNAAATAEAVDADGWFRSGDAGYLDDDGYLYIHDRVKDMIVSGGENVYPAEVENVLMSHAGIADVAVIGVPHEKWGETAKAIVVQGRRRRAHRGRDHRLRPRAAGPLQVPDERRLRRRAAPQPERQDAQEGPARARTGPAASARSTEVRNVIRRVGKNVGLYQGDPPSASVELERDGFAVLRGVLDPDEVAALAAEIEQSFVERDAERARSDREEFRYQMLNHGPCSQAAVGHPAILAAIEPLLGEDCHVIANTAWRNPPEFGGGPWHCDAGPHVPRPEDVEWDDRIPYPVFAIGAHIVLKDCPLECGPTAVVPGSHRSGRLAPRDRLDDPDLTYDGRAPVALTALAGDVALFVSDVWHRGTPAAGGDGRLFLQVHYGRRDIAQRIRPTTRSTTSPRRPSNEP